MSIQRCPPVLRTEVINNYGEARSRIEEIYGSVESNPKVIACSTQECFEKFGGASARALNYGSIAFLLSPRGLTPEIISHEWSHNELYVRIGSFFKWLKIPQWLDEGLAVVVSNEPTHSQAVWDVAQKNGVPIPDLDELVSLKDWHRALDKYGEKNETVTNPDRLRIVYATAGNEVRQWYKVAGKNGLLELIRSIRSDEKFQNVYAHNKFSSIDTDSIKN